MTAPAPYTIMPPRGADTPLVLDSPHSGRWFPSDLPLAVSEHDLREPEDHFVDELFGGAPDHGAALLAASFSRAYVDPNRHPGDVDLDLLDGPWPHDWQPSGKARIGKAVVWRTIDDGRPIYTRRLSAAEVAHRIDAWLRPYQRALAGLLDDAHARHGVVVHLNCHSMQSVAGPMGEGRAGNPRADIVLGDRDGTTCSAALTAHVHAVLSGLGYEVKVNDPFKGVELVRAFADPARGRHSLQVELNKRLYMDEATRRPHEGFERLRRDLDRLLASLAGFAATLRP
jgi:N-formylglutamate amidohydrolase